MYIQRILFGGPGSGKSHYVSKQIIEDLHISEEIGDVYKVVFHPEYTYGDFMGKLLPMTKGDKVTYQYYAGHFLQAIAKAYQNILFDPENPKNVLLLIDEINRGNSSAIFGTIFQLLDRDSDGWSSYEVSISEMEYTKMLELIGIEYDGASYKVSKKIKNLCSRESYICERKDELDSFKSCILDKIRIVDKRIRIPKNLSIVATMNTSDNSIFYLDTAFKRRWEWEYVTGAQQPASIEGGLDWNKFVDKLNMFFKKNYRLIHKIEDKQIGYWFIKAVDGTVSKNQIKNKLMFFVWDSVFTRDKQSLSRLLECEPSELVTFGDFSNKVEIFIEKVMAYV